MSAVKKEFNAEISKLLNLVIHSLYTDKDVFIRELISNASDACNKRRYLALSNQSLLPTKGEFSLSIAIDSEKKTIIFEDNGIGMDDVDMEQNIGTIAGSGTQKFLQQGGNNIKDLIGQFGVGFYASFMVSELVEVISKKAGTDKTYRWTSNGESDYSIEEIGDIGLDGTRIICHLKSEDAEKFIDKYHIEYAIKHRSNYIDIPIYLTLNDEKSDKPVNSRKAIWNKAKHEITDEEYKEFYNNVSNLPGEQFMTCHYKIEGSNEFNALLFVPGMKPFDLFHPDMMTRVKLYSKSVCIGDSAENASLNLIPRYLRFLRGVVDSNDIPLNISRETLQDSGVVAKIKSTLVKKFLNDLKKVKDESPIDNTTESNDSQKKPKYQEFWNNFGAVLKEGLCEYTPDRDALLKLCYFKSLKNTEKYISVEDYIASMKEGQEKIYYYVGENIDDMINSPQLEGFKKKDIDVILLCDPVDRVWVTTNINCDGKDFKSITHSDINLDKIDAKADEEKKEVDSIESQEICTAFKKALDGLVKDVKSSKRLYDSPMCLSVEDGAMDIQMERFLIEQGQLRQAALKIIEINTEHQLIKDIYQKLKEDANDKTAIDKLKILFELSCITQGNLPKQPNEFMKKVVSLMG